MAEAKKPALEKGIAPAGPCGRFAALLKPDYGTDAYPKPNGEWKVSVIYSEEESAAIRAKVEAKTEAFLAETKKDLEKKLADAKTGPEKKKVKDAIEKLHTHYPWDEGVDDEGEADGTYILKFGSPAAFKDKKTDSMRQKPLPLFDCSVPKPKEIKPESIWGGSIVKPAFDYMPYYVAGTGMVGIKLRLNAVQIVELVQGGGAGSASSYGFSGSEDGYQSDAPDSDDHGFGGDDSTSSGAPQEDNPNF